MVFGNLSTGYWLGVAGAPPHWQELGRTTLGAASDDITVSSLANKPYLMVLAQSFSSGATRQSLRFNGDSGSNYARRISFDGSADATAINQSNALLQADNETVGEYSVTFINNISSEEKLLTSHSMRQIATGASQAPGRSETVAKWANTSNAISSVTLHDVESGQFNTDSQVVVLGFDPADTSGTNFWQELASVELGATASILDSGTFTAKKYLWGQIYAIGSGSINANLRFNSDTGSNYASRYSSDGAADSTSASRTNIINNTNDGSENSFINFFIINKSDKEKLVISQEVNQQTAGAGNAPSRNESTSKWANTSNQITKITTKSGGTYGIGSFIKVWGAD